jgi:hypothetical protein
MINQTFIGYYTMDMIVLCGFMDWYSYRNMVMKI